MIHEHELAVPPIRALVFRLIDDKIWERHLLGFTWVRIEFVKLDDDVIEDLKARYKVEVVGNNPIKELLITWGE